MSATILYLNAWPGDLVQKLKIAGMRRYAGARGWSVESVPSGDSRPGKIRGILAAHAPVAGCIVEGSSDNVRLPSAPFGKIPVVYLQASPTLFGGRIARIGVDNEAIARAAFHELSSGHPAGYAVVGNCVGFEWTIARERAFAALAAEAGAECRVFAMRRGKPGEPPGRRAAALAEWVAALPCHTAVFAVHDYCAAETVAAAHAAHRAIPRELTLCGVDNLTDVCEASHPTITSIQLDHERSGFLAARMLAGRMTDCASRRMTDAAGAANDQISSLLPSAARHCASGASSLPPLAARHCGEAARHCGEAARHCGEAARHCGEAARHCYPTVATVGPLLTVRRESTRGSGRRESFILEAVEMIRREATEGLRASRLAARFPCSRSLFYLRFREAMGHSVLDEILNVRFEKVFTLLSQTDTPIGAIADFCGFRSAIALKWIFRKRTGMSMRQWRALNRR